MDVPEVVLNSHGYYELKDKPTQLDLERHYSQKYFQESKGFYRQQHSQEEPAYIFAS
jgi:hypothetical protein